MGPFAMVAVALQIIFWFSLLAVAAVFVAALIRGVFEAITNEYWTRGSLKDFYHLPHNGSARLGPGTCPAISRHRLAGLFFSTPDRSTSSKTC